MAQKEEYKSIDDKDMPALGRSCVFDGICWSGVFTSASFASVLLQTAFKSGKICSLFCGRNVLNKKFCCMWNVECRMSCSIINSSSQAGIFVVVVVVVIKQANLPILSLLSYC